MTCRVMPDRIPTEEVERIANRNDCLAAVTALRALAAERDELAQKLAAYRSALRSGEPETESLRGGYTTPKHFARRADLSGENQP